MSERACDIRYGRVQEPCSTNEVGLKCEGECKYTRRELAVDDKYSQSNNAGIGGKSDIIKQILYEGVNGYS